MTDSVRVTVAISPGEALDKLAILAIKAERLADAQKLAHVQREAAVLQEAGVLEEAFSQVGRRVCMHACWSPLQMSTRTGTF